MPNVKIFRTLSTSLDKDQFERVEKICEHEGCKPYTVLKDALLQYVDSYEEALKDESGKGKGKGEDSTAGETESKHQSGNNKGDSRESNIGQVGSDPERVLDLEREPIEVTA